jgi:hypothetical protein
MEAQMFEAQRELTLEEIEWGPEGKPSKELLEVRACMAKINERERLQKVAKEKEALPYSDAHPQEICERVAVGELLINICLDEHLPTMRRCNQWLRQYPEFNQLYQSAINDRLNIFEEEVIKIADDMKHDFRTVIKNGVEKRVSDPEMVARAKLRIEVRFRHLKAMHPQRWGETSTLITKSANEFDPSTFTQEELERQIADIESKSARPAALSSVKLM